MLELLSEPQKIMSTAYNRFRWGLAGHIIIIIIILKYNLEPRSRETVPQVAKDPGLTYPVSVVELVAETRFI